jgi:hypothetical protein
MGEKIGVKNEKVRWREYLDFLSLHTIFYNLKNYHVIKKNKESKHPKQSHAYDANFKI